MGRRRSVHLRHLLPEVLERNLTNGDSPMTTLGTCKCCGDGTSHMYHFHNGSITKHCRRPATQLVSMSDPDLDSSCEQMDHDVPMCAPCAAHAERGGTK